MNSPCPAPHLWTRAASLNAVGFIAASVLLAGCASAKLPNHAQNIDAVQLAVSFVEARARVLRSPTLDMDLLETMAMEPVFAVGETGVLEKTLSQPEHLRRTISKSMAESIKSFPLGKSDYSLDSRIPLYGFVEIQDQGGGRFFVVVSSSLVGPDGRLWERRVLGVSPKTTYSAVVRGQMNHQEGLSLALHDASAKIEAALHSDSQAPLQN